MSNNPNASIGIFDSGVGGLTVMQQIMHHLPCESVIYLGDTARTPYGNKSPETILRYSIENTLFLLEKNIKMLVVACNTASAHALEKLQDIFKIPVLGVIQPGAERAVALSPQKRIAILGTKGTIQSQAYEKEILRLAPKAALTPIACPLLVPLVEENFLNNAAAQMIVKEYLRPLKDSLVDTVLLACTHYPAVRHLILKELNSNVTIVDPSSSCAEKVASTLKYCGIETKRGIAEYQYFVSDDPEKFKVLSRQLFGLSTHPHLIKTAESV